MSQLIDKLNRASRATSQPMGFRTARTAESEPRIMLIVSLAQSGDISRLADGADAILLQLTKSDLTAKKLSEISGTLPDIPWGYRLEDIGTKKMETLVGASCDFMVFAAASRVTDTPEDDKTGKILQVESSLDDSLLRAVNDLPVDAVLATSADEVKNAIAWDDLIRFQRLSNLTAKPLLVPATLKLTAGELKSLWEAGVHGVVVEADSSQPEALKELRSLIDGITFPTSRKRGKAGALLPHTGGFKEEQPEVEEEDDDYE